MLKLYDKNALGLVPYYLRDNEVAYSLPVVVRVERNIVYDSGDAFKAVSLGMVEILTDVAWVEVLEPWMRGRIRKVVRRARGARWERLKALPHKLVRVNNCEVMIFQPHVLSEAPAEIKSLQVEGTNFNPLIVDNSVNVLSGVGVSMAFNTHLGMSTGKAMAQIGHAVQMFMFTASQDVLDLWERNDFRLCFVSWVDNFLVDDLSVVVKDAGFTEIAVGSETVQLKWIK